MALPHHHFHPGFNGIRRDRQPLANCGQKGHSALESISWRLVADCGKINEP
jgi:hypothetical protein